MTPQPRILSFPRSVNTGLVRLRRIAATLVGLVTLLLITLLSAACGSGISVDDPTNDPPPHSDRDGDTADIALSDGGRDAPTGSDTSPVDGLADRSELPVGADESADVSGGDGSNGDGTSSVPDVSLDGDSAGGEDVSGGDGSGGDASDVPSDRAWDQSVDGVTPRDASHEITADIAADMRRDGDAPIVFSDVRDASDESTALPDAAEDTQLDLPVGNGDGCSVGCEVEYYVDASAAPGGDGSKAAPFRTISAAVAAHMLAPDRPRTAHIAAGTYDTALGETFPLELRGLSLDGAGSNNTLIVGAGSFDHAGQGGPRDQQYTVTIVAGDRSLPTNISRLSVRPSQPVPEAGLYGVFCDRGNATSELASPAGQTHLDEVSIGPGFDTSVLAVASTNPVVTGCNVLMTRTTVTGGWVGVLAEGCNGSAAPVPVVLEMGTDDPASGNTVTWMQGQNGMGNGVFLNNCVARASFQYNTIADCSSGINAGGSTVGPNPSATKPFLFKNNTFSRMSNIGLYVWGSAIFIQEISGNRFLDSTRTADSFLGAVGLRIEQPVVGPVRRNVFAGNDIGLRLDMGAEQTDLGRPGDPGANTFYCNSGIDGWLGSDVDIVYPMIRGSRGLREDDGGADDAAADDAAEGGPAGLPFAGNAWDQGPPRVESSDLATNGVEISLEWAPPLVFDSSGSTLVTTTCPAGRIR